MAFWSRKSDPNKAKKNNSEQEKPAPAQGQRLDASPANGSMREATNPVGSMPLPVRDPAQSQPAAVSPKLESLNNAVATSSEQETDPDAAAKSRQIMATFGEIVSVMMRSPQFNKLPLGEVDALVSPAVLTNQFLVAKARSEKSGLLSPVAAALWASVSDEVDHRLSSDLSGPLRLQSKDWRSGDIPWLIVLAGDKRAIIPLLKQVRETKLGGRNIKMRAKGKEGVPVVHTVGDNSSVAEGGV